MIVLSGGGSAVSPRGDERVFESCRSREVLARCPVCGEPGSGLEIGAQRERPRLLAVAHRRRRRRCVVGEVVGVQIAWGAWGEA